MNMFRKYAPNVFVAQCFEQHTKGAIIEITTKYGKAVEVELHNFLGRTRDGFFLYSQTRVDGTTNQTWAEKRADRLEGAAANAEARSEKYYQASQEGRDFLSLGEPIKVGHHSEMRHRALIERNDNRMRKSVEEAAKAQSYEDRIEYWKARAEKIDLSMPESLEYFEHVLEEKTRYHQDMKAGKIPRLHSMALQYASRDVKTAQANLDIAMRLWG